ARALDVPEDRRLLHPQANVQRDRNKKDRDQKWKTPAPRSKSLAAHRVLHGEDHRERQEQPERGGDLNKAGVEASLCIRHMLGDINRGAAILASEREPLQDANKQKNDWRGDPDRRIRREKPDESGRASHDQQRYKKSILSADKVAYSPEEQRAKRAHDEPNGECRKIRDERERLVARGV